MKRGIRCGVTVLAAAGLLGVSACASSSSGASGPGGAGAVSTATTTLPGAIGSIPVSPAGAAEHSGTITWAMLSNNGPVDISPNPGSNDDTVNDTLTFTYQMWRPLYWVPDGASPQMDPKLSLASPPAWSDGRKRLTIKLKNWNWSDGKPVTSTDLEFAIDLIRAGLKLSPANWDAYTPGYFPDTLTSMSTPDSKTLVITLSKAGGELYTMYDILAGIQAEPSFAWAKTSASGSIEPKSAWNADYGRNATAEAIWKFLNKQGADTATFASDPLWQLVYGPYRISAYDTTSHGYTLVPNTRYSGPHAKKMSAFQAVAYTSETAMWNAVQGGNVDVSSMPSAYITQLRGMAGRGWDYFGLPDFGQDEMIYNFKNTTGFGAIISQLYVRQALQQLQDQELVVEKVFHGAGDPSYGPVPVSPQNAYVPPAAARNPYPFSVTGAESLLAKHGWKVTPGGTDICQRPGLAASDCGAGIPAGAKLAFGLDYYSGMSSIKTEVTSLAGNARKAGIVITLHPEGDFNKLVTDDNDAASPSLASSWDVVDFGGFTDSTYPTEVQLLAPKSSLNLGGYDSAKANKMMSASANSADPAAVVAEAGYLSQDLPVLWQPLQDYTWLWQSKVRSTTPKAFEALTQYAAEPEFWYLSG